MILGETETDRGGFVLLVVAKWVLDVDFLFDWVVCGFNGWV